MQTSAVTELTATLLAHDAVAEVAILATCNRLEVYAAVEMFHAGVEFISRALADATGIAFEELSEHLFVRFGQNAVEHAFAVTAGLDSMAVGESQIIGQVRHMLQVAHESKTVGQCLDPLLQRALHVSKRVHSETDLDHAGPSLVEGAIEHAGRVLPEVARAHKAVVVGAGGMSGLVVATLKRYDIHSIVVANRSRERAERLVTQYGTTWVELTDRAALNQHLAEADFVFSCTGAQGYVLGYDQIAEVRGLQSLAGQNTTQQVFIDLALPRDIDPMIDEFPGILRIDLEQLGLILADRQQAQALVAAHAIVAQESENFAETQRARSVGPTLAALQRRADEVVEQEVTRVQRRLGDQLSSEARAEVEQAVRRVANKLLHTPTVRMKSLTAGQAIAPDYVSAVRNLFDLDQVEDTTVAGVSALNPPTTSGTGAR